MVQVPPPHIPQEIIEAIIDAIPKNTEDESSETRQVLATCMNVSRSFHHRSRKLRFSTMHIDCIQVPISPNTYELRGVYGFLNVFRQTGGSGDSELMRLIEKVHLRMSIRDWDTMPEELIASALEALQIMRDRAVNCQTFWLTGYLTQFVSSFPESLVDFLSGPDEKIRHLRLSGVADIPMSFITSLNSLKSLELQGVDLRETEEPWVPRCLESLEVDLVKSPYPFFPSIRLDLSRLRRFDAGNLDLNALKQLVRQARSSLEVLHITYHPNPSDSPIDLSSLPTLRTLHFWAFLNLGDGEIPHPTLIISTGATSTSTTTNIEVLKVVYTCLWYISYDDQRLTVGPNIKMSKHPRIPPQHLHLRKVLLCFNISTLPALETQDHRNGKEYTPRDIPTFERGMAIYLREAFENASLPVEDPSSVAAVDVEVQVHWKRVESSSRRIPS